MRIHAVVRGVTRGIVAGALLLILAGCDYWPPALQAQIEQLKNEAKQAATERVVLEEQLNTATKVRNDLQARVDELAKANDQLAARASALELDLVAERKKHAQIAAESKKAATNKTAKPRTKTPAKAKKKSSAAKPAKPSAQRSNKLR